MAIFDGVKEVLNTAKDAQTLPALRERLELAKEQLAIVEKKTAELEAENIDLFRENRELRKENDSLKAKTAELESKPVIKDIGPCSIKLNNQGQRLTGFYCNSCQSHLEQFNSMAGCLLQCRKCGTYTNFMDDEDALKFYLESDEIFHKPSC